jgi:hypothetical protein
MNFKLFYFFILLISVFSCSKKITLENEMDCSNFISITQSNKKTDINKNFTIEVPKKWKHHLYYDDTQSTIFMADTIKELVDTYIIDVSKKNGELRLNQEFEDTLNNHTDLNILKSSFENFKELPAYWKLSRGTKKKFIYHVFNLFVKISDVTYIEIKTEIYGDKNVDERLCESFKLISSLEILK